jgi:hypothetical protein
MPSSVCWSVNWLANFLRYISSSSIWSRRSLIQDNRPGLAAFPEVDESCDEDQRKSENHPVLKRDARKRDLLG